MEQNIYGGSVKKINIKNSRVTTAPFLLRLKMKNESKCMLVFAGVQVVHISDCLPIHKRNDSYVFQTM